MLERIIETTLHQRGLIVFLSLVIAVVGVYSYLTLPIDAFPGRNEHPGGDRQSCRWTVRN